MVRQAAESERKACEIGIFPWDRRSGHTSHKEELTNIAGSPFAQFRATRSYVFNTECGMGSEAPGGHGLVLG